LNEINKNQLISLCKDKYKNNDIELRIIQEFEHTYSSTRSLSWFTRNCFLNRILNKAFQIENISLLLDCLFFIRDIQQQIEINKSSSIHQVYHCRLISKEELGILYKSIGQFISMNTFLSASPDRQQAISIFQDYETSENIFKILFEIDINPQFHDIKSFADITSFSYSSNIKEILFMIGSIFRIENFSQDKNGIIIISMTKHSQPILDHFKNEDINHKKTLLSLGHMLWKLNRFDDAEKCYYHLIQNLPDTHPNISKCYHALGNIASDRNDYDTSLECHEKALNIKKNTLSEFDSSFAYSYNSLGAVYHQIGDYKHALELYKQALDIWKKEYDENHLYIAMCYNNMGLVYERIEKSSEALDCYQKVLIIRQKILPNDHIELGDIYQNLGITYQSLRQFDLALKYFNQSLIIFKKSHHPNIPMILNYLGIIYEDQSQLQDALSNYQQALTIYRQSLSSTHYDIIETEKNIQRLMAKLDN
jgi:tetratricopeptide (TPR) repeat protein